MRLCTPRPTVPRTWTVDLRPHPCGLELACPLCGPPATVERGVSARSAVLTHLARHARAAALPRYLRTCQCHERGCRWHPRHRGCSGPVILVLACERGGRRWRLADVCTSCAGATPDAAVVPETLSCAPPAHRARRSRRAAADTPSAQERVRDLLSYLASALPPSVSPGTRLLALQCALRTDRHGQVTLAAGFLRGMRLYSYRARAWQELEQARWLRHLPGQTGTSERLQLLDVTVLTQAPDRVGRHQAADWVLRTAHAPVLRDLPARLRLTMLALGTSTPPGEGGYADIEQLSRACALPEERLERALLQLADTGLLATWSFNRENGQLYWQAPGKSARLGAVTPRPV
ncbi:hypothetical protein ACFYN0_34660 [Streptomyces sp. NPDC006704]|uniref:hypothetical protein n=1 Tax=Streptomyces sp. NPDC006704 TaxID=3364760 RepID=UPI0036D14ED2